jgi:hypothetical protein
MKSLRFMIASPDSWRMTREISCNRHAMQDLGFRVGTGPQALKNLDLTRRQSGLDGSEQIRAHSRLIAMHRLRALKARH